MTAIIFEDYTFNNYYPLNLNRPTYDLKCGIYSFIERIESYYKTINVIVREEIQSIIQHPQFNFDSIEKNKNYLFFSSTFFFQDSDLIPDENEVLFSNDRILSFKISDDILNQINYDDFFKKNVLINKLLDCGVKKKEIKSPKLDYLFNLIDFNEKAIEHDFKAFKLKSGNLHNINKNVTLIGKNENLFIHENSIIDPGVYINTENGPVIIDEDSKIRPLTTIEGPCYIGKNSLVDGAKIRSGTSIFDVCKIAGEIENSIIFSYTNKHHDGFLGHAYIGSFVNFGAMATNSDLKNNYGNVKIQLEEKIIDTELIKVGCFIGDHTKLGIGSLINTGSVIGFACNLYFDGGMYPKYIASFSWGSKESFVQYDFKKFIENTKKVLQRRKKILSIEEEKLYLKIFEKNKS